MVESCRSHKIIVRLITFFFPFSEDRSKQPETVFMSQEDLASVLRERVSDCPEEILDELSEHLVR